jgi:hypothetical protein
VGHDAAVDGVRVAGVVEVARLPVVHDALVALASVVLAAVEDGILERELLAVLVRRAAGGELQLVALAVIIVESVGVFVFFK